MSVSGLGGEGSEEGGWFARERSAFQVGGVTSHTYEVVIGKGGAIGMVSGTACLRDLGSEAGKGEVMVGRLPSSSFWRDSENELAQTVGIGRRLGRRAIGLQPYDGGI